MRPFIITGLTLLLATACGGKDDAVDTAGTDTAAAIAPAGNERVRTAATVANAIQANPARGDSILQANGHTRESFEALMFEIASDSAMSAEYAATKTP